jgi:hypothetical protein
MRAINILLSFLAKIVASAAIDIFSALVPDVRIVQIVQSPSLLLPRVLRGEERGGGVSVLDTAQNRIVLEPVTLNALNKFSSYPRSPYE